MRILLLGVLFSISIFSQVNAGGLESGLDIGKACRALLGSVGVSENSLDKPDERAALVGESYQLVDLLGTDPDSLVAKHPWMIMNSGQRTLDLILSQGVSQVPDPFTGMNFYTKYNLFSGAVDLTDQKFIAGQLHGLEVLVKNISGRADQTRTSLSVVLLNGVPGTGKSVTLELLQRAFKNATTNDPKRHYLVYEWVNLAPIKELEGLIPAKFLENDVVEGYVADRFDSPFVLLPTVLQDAILKQNEKVVVDAINRKPLPKLRSPDKGSERIKDLILRHYSKEKKRPLTAIEAVEALNKHVRIRRLVLGDGITCPIISAQSKDVDMGSLLAKKKPLVSLVHGTSEPLAWDWGKLMKANGGVIFFDEVGKNEEYLRRVLLNFTQALTLNVEGSPENDMDVVIIMATNIQDMKAILAKEPQSPFKDRVTAVDWNQLVRPTEIAQLILGQNIKDLEIRKLGEPDSKFIRARPRDVVENVFPERENSGDSPQTAHRRYALRLNNGTSTPIDIAPLTFEYAASVLALSRSNFTPDAYKGIVPIGIINSNDAVFRDPITRLSALWGDPTISQAVMRDLSLASIGASEGSYGMMQRDWERWFELAIMQAGKEKGIITLTPGHMFKTLITGIHRNELLGDTGQLRLQVANFAQALLYRYVAPKASDDFQVALAESDAADAVAENYRQFMEETFALSTSPTATRYTDSLTRQFAPINFERRKKIIEHYQIRNKRRFEEREVIGWIVSYSASRPKDGSTQVHPGVYDAVSTYHAKLVLEKEQISMSRLMDVALGQAGEVKDAERARSQEFMRVLENRLGYSPKAAREMLEVVSNTDRAESDKQK